MDHLAKKKILFLITQSKYGGAQKYVLELARYFSKTNEVLIAVGDTGHQDPHFFAEARSLGIEPIILSSLVRDISLVKAWDALFEIRRLLAKECPDFLHINSSMAGAIGSCAAWLYRLDPLHKAIRVIYTVHGFVFNEPLPYFRKKVYLFMEKISASWKGALICVSRYDKEQGLAHKIAPEKRMVVIHNGIDARQPLLTRAEARTKLGLSESQFIIGTVASLYPTKGLTTMLDALASLRSDLPAYHYIILGDGPLRAELEQKVLDLKLNENVIFKGDVPSAGLLMRAFDLFVLPSLKEGFPYALLEAGLAGVPVIASRIGGIPELITHQKHGLLTEAGNTADLALSIKELTRQPNQRSTFGSALEKKVRTEFTRETMLIETEKLYLQFYQKPVTSS